MKPFRTFVNEVFEADTKWRSYWRGPEKEFGADLSAYGIRFTYKGGVYMVHIISGHNDPDDTSIWSVDFGLFSGPKGAGVTDPYAITGTGESIPVFSIVLDILMAFIQKRRPKHIMFSAKEPNRANLYKRMITKLIPKFELNYKLSSQYKVDDGTTDFILTRVDQEPDELNEVFNTKVEWDKNSLKPFRGEENYEVNFSIGSYRFTVNFIYNSDGVFKSGPSWEITFARLSESGWYDYYVINDNKIAFKLFSVVTDIILKFIEWHRPESFYFSAAEKSRQKLYQRLSTILINKIPKYQLSIYNPYEDMYFVFENNPDISKINEVFNTKIEWNRDLIQKTKRESWPYEYKPIRIPIEIDGIKFTMIFEFSGGDDWFFSFVRLTDEMTVLGDDSLINDKKFQFKVFSVVIDVVQEFIKRIKPKVFEFAARKSEESRIKLYDRLVSVIGGKNPNYTSTTMIHDMIKYYTFTQKAMARYLDESEEVMVESENMDSLISVLKDAVRGSEWETKLFIAGGAIRDELLNLPSKDVDFVVEGGPDAGMDAATFIAKKLGVYKPESNPVLFPTYGTAKLSIPVEGKNFDVEFVAPRKERYEPGSRKPSVSPGTLRDDALRRDFTINALFKNLMTGEILDLSGRGLKDLKDRVLNTTGDADWIFSEDPLRILRAVRFTLKYNLRLPLTVIRAIKKAAPSLATISAERIQDELKKILLLAQPSKAIRLFKMTGILDQILPELKALDKLKQNKFHTKDALGHTLDVLDNTPANLHERLAALFHDVGKAATRTEKDGKIQFIGHAEVGSDLTKAIMKRLKYSNEDIEKVSRLVKYHMDLKSVGKDAEGLSEKTLRKFIYRVASELEPLLNLIHADNISHTPEASMPKQIEKVRERIADLNIEEILNTQSVLDGNEIMALGAKGKLIGEIKNRILTKTIENPGFTKEQAINLAQNMIKDKAQ